MKVWYNEAVFYHIYPLGLLGAPFNNTGSEIEHHVDELELWIPHLVSLGVTAVYIGPLFESSTHGYDTIDYKLVDRRIGDNSDFKHFVEACHNAEIKVVVDGVFNHTGREFFAFKDIREKRENSSYRDWYKGINFGGNTKFNDGFWYEAWRGYHELANLNLQNPQVKQYLLDVIRFWIKEFDIDGIRLDCADCLDFNFLKEMRWVTSQEKEDFWLMGEVIHGDYSRWANDDMLHSVTNYELHKGLFSGHNDHNYFEIAHTIRRLFDERGGLVKGRTLYSFADNHDVDRIASKLQKKEHLPLIYLLLYSLPGIPSIYYGSEWGIEGRKEHGSDEPLRPAIDIRKQMGQSLKITDNIAQLGKLHRKYDELCYGYYRELALTNRQYVYARYMESSAVVVAANCDDHPQKVTIPPFLSATKAMNLMKDEPVAIENNGSIILELAPNSGTMIWLSK